ncbi:MAG: ComEA family DNA-binding protein [Actinomycetes bacterium]
MFQIPEFSEVQKRAVYIVLASSVAVGSLFVTLSQGKASTPKPMVVLPSVSTKPSVLPTVVVDVAGKVLHPGVYTLPQGSRAIDAIKAAGNQLKGVLLTDINLAEIVSDGEQIVVGAPAKVVSASKSKSSSIAKNGKTLVNINTASAAALQVLKGIGPVTAQKVVAYRKANGKFTLISDFKKASGMGATRFNAISSQLRL